MASLAKRIDNYGDKPEGLDPRSALESCAGAMDLYTQEPRHLALFEEQKLRVLHNSTKPLPATQLLPPHVAGLYRQFCEEDPQE